MESFTLFFFLAKSNDIKIQAFFFSKMPKVISSMETEKEEENDI